MKYIKINPADNVAVALQDLSKGEVVEGVTLRMDIPRGHKIVLYDLRENDNVIKYGFPIGHVTRDAAAGTMVYPTRGSEKHFSPPKTAHFFFIFFIEDVQGIPSC